MMRSILVCFVALSFVACFLETKNIPSEDVSLAGGNSNVSISNNSNNEKLPIASPTPSQDDSPLPLAVILPTEKELKTKGGKSAVLKAYLTGAWETINNPKGCRNIYIEFPSSDYLCVQSNHIYIEAYYRLDLKQQKVNVYLKKTKDLSEAALHTPWKDIDNNKPIAVIDVSKALSMGLIEVKWLGFANKKTGEVYDYGKDDHNGTHRKQIGNE